MPHVRGQLQSSVMTRLLVLVACLGAGMWIVTMMVAPPDDIRRAGGTLQAGRDGDEAPLVPGALMAATPASAATGDVALSPVRPHAASEQPAARARPLPESIRRLSEQPMSGPLRPVISGEALPLPAQALSRATGLANTARIRVERANVRSGPSTGHQVIGRLDAADEVSIIEEDPSGWVRIRVEGDGIDGWIAKRLLDRG